MAERVKAKDEWVKAKDEGVKAKDGEVPDGAVSAGATPSVGSSLNLPSQSSEFSEPSSHFVNSQSSKPICSVCRRTFSLTKTGVVRQHGPCESRCPGSRLPPLSCSVGLGLQKHVTSLPMRQLAESSSLPMRQLPVSINEPFEISRFKGKILKRIPRASRELAAKKFTSCLDSVVRHNDFSSWKNLLEFSARGFRAPQRGGRRNHHLATMVNLQLREGSMSQSSIPNYSYSTISNPFKSLARHVSAKLEEGDFKGAVRLASSEDTLADFSDATLSALRAKHPPPHPNSIIPPSPVVNENDRLEIVEEELAYIIRLFPNGSAGGHDGLRPQHLKDMINSSIGGCTAQLLSALA